MLANKDYVAKVMIIIVKATCVNKEVDAKIA